MKFSTTFWQLSRFFKLIIWVGFACILFTVVIVFYIFAKSNDNLIYTANWIEHTKEVLYQSERIISAVKDVETGTRGYLLTGKKEFLEPFTQGSIDVPLFLEQIKKLTKDNPKQQFLIANLSLLATTKINLCIRLIQLRKFERIPSDQQLSLITKGKYIMDSIRRTMDSIQNEENRLLIKRKADNEASISKTHWRANLFGSLMIVILLAGLILILGYFNSIKKANAIIQSRNNELKRLSIHLKNIREDERKQISREVHDELGQLASVIKMDGDWLTINLTSLEKKIKTRIERIISTATIMIDTSRNIAMSLRPSAIDDIGINGSLKVLCSELQETYNIQCDYEGLPNDEKISIPVRVEFYRICQECITNILRHANATQITISITDMNHSIQLKVTDNGKGFDTNETSTHLGLVGIRERAFSMNAELRITSDLGKGTTIIVNVPKN